MSRITASGSGIALGGELDLSTLMQYRRDLQVHLPLTGQVRVDLSGLVFKGSAVLALLVMIAREARHNDAAVEFVGANNGLRDMADLAGLTALVPLSE